jgi:hypothetical protein
VSDNADFADTGRTIGIQTCLCSLVPIGMKKSIELPYFRAPRVQISTNISRYSRRGGMAISGYQGAVELLLPDHVQMWTMWSQSNLKFDNEF